MCILLITSDEETWNFALADKKDFIDSYEKSGLSKRQFAELNNLIFFFEKIEFKNYNAKSSKKAWTSFNRWNERRS